MLRQPARSAGDLARDSQPDGCSSARVL